jgi:tetratricopeptide (TPR) repeat protein
VRGPADRGGNRYGSTDRRGERTDDQQPAFQAPEIPEDIVASDLDKEVRSELLTLSRDTADQVARHLVAAGQIIDEDADLALSHAIAARRLASRIAVVREAVGLAAYAAGDWATAIAELRTYHRMTGRQTHLAEIADCERALGRPERAIDLYRGADRDALDKAGAIELLIVAAGARGDLGQHDAAVAMLQVRELTADEDAEWAARLRYAYADALLAAGRREEAREWFARAAAVDHDDVTDAAERLLELDGVTLEDDSDETEDEDAGEPLAWADDESDEDGDERARRTDDESDADVDDARAAWSDDESDADADDARAVWSDDEFAADDNVLATRSGGGSGEDDLVGDDPADQEWSEEHEDAERSRAVAFVDGVETALDKNGDLDDEDDLADEDDLRESATTGDAASAGIDEPTPGRPVGDSDDEKTDGDEFVAAAVEDDPAVTEDGADSKRPQA